jgi:acyl-coenzyme A thioesterase PaaI-like protein
LLNADEVFLTGDLRVEYYRSAKPGLLLAEGHVVRRARRVIFCAADLYQDDTHIAGARCTQIVLPADGSAGRMRRTPPDDA